MDFSTVTGSSLMTGAGWGTGLLSSQINSQEFYNLLLTELQNQDPFEPMQHSELLAQLAQFSMLEQTECLSLGMWEMASLQRLSDGCSLIGYEIEYIDPATGESVTGIVSSVRREAGGVFAEVGEDRIPLDWIVRVSPPSENGSNGE